MKQNIDNKQNTNKHLLDKLSVGAVTCWAVNKRNDKRSNNVYRSMR